jgi:hypothetical protein
VRSVGTKRAKDRVNQPAPVILKKCFRKAAQFTEQQKVPALRVLK